MIVVGVRFKKVGKIYYFDPENNQYSYGQNVIVETSRGIEFGMVVIPNRDVNDDTIVPPLKPIIRVANSEDIEKNKENKEKSQEAFQICKEKIKAHKLDMRLISSELTFDNSKLIFYFTADGRIDFRELVKDLAAIYKTRIELRQIGVRDEVKRIGGNGVCGRELCCCSFLRNFETVSIKMAKEQNISLNPSKISGNCGRLMCCLKYEQEVYEDKLKRLPNVGAIVKTSEGVGEVEGVEILKEQIKVKFKDGDGWIHKKYKSSEINIIKDNVKETINDEELEHQKELEELEKLEEIDVKNLEEI